MAQARKPILLVEDTPSLSDLYATLLRRAGREVECAFTLAEARARFAAGGHRLVLLDLVLPDGDGIDALREMRARDPNVRAIVATSNGSINRAVEAMRAGAFDFLVKPFDEARLLRAVEQADAAPASPHLVAPPEPDAQGFQGFVGLSPAMRAVYETIRDVGRSTATVFITGESGTGKELAAQAIHDLSPRRDRPFVPLNCGAIPRDLLESEVFGHLKGSFTGAISDKPGAAATADGGTLFLDEICEMDIDLQTKLLRFLQTSTIQPVGAASARKVDVRIVCATNRDPQTEVDAGRFRSDLFYRLYVVPIHLPPLRERGDDVLRLADKLLADYARVEGKRFAGLSDTVRAAFRAYPWPGNVREVQNVLRNVAVLRDGPLVTPEMLPAKLAACAGAIPPGPASRPAPAGAPNLREALAPLVGATLSEVEREFIEQTIDACGGSIPRAARILDVSPSTLYRKRESWERADAQGLRRIAG
ncbi:MAG: sigma-54-dependent transcriptional regulator [Rubrimonas sp.]|uniref:sigma-54-dependent transcriptional regulator n=1 Tax=Rubrimonas sp. TaxID=2036015 RepID=UPI002FDCE838